MKRSINKRLASLMLVFMLVLTIMPVGALAEEAAVFTDIGHSPYEEAIVQLYDKGVIAQPINGRFRPEDPLTKAELSALMVRGFKLPEIQSLDVEEKVEKKFTYTDTLGVIDDGFVVYSADDIKSHWGENYIEGLIKVRAIDVEEDGLFKPEENITKKEFYQVLGKVLFGVDEKVDYIEKLNSLNLLDEKDLSSKDTITREEAAGALNKILSNSNFKVLTILATADIHGHIEPYKPSGADREIGGMAKMKKFVDETRKRQPNTLLVDIGDAPYNTNVANMFKGKPVIEIMNMMEYDAMVLGNHDFDFPQDVMKTNAELAKFPFLSANTYYNDSYPEYLKPSIIKDIDGIRVAIVGLTDDSSGYYTHPNNVKGVEFEDHFEAAKREVDEVKDNSDIIISLAHLHNDNAVLGEKIQGIDFVFGGGTDIVDYPRKTGDSWLISSGKHAELVSQTNINMIDNQMIGFNFGHIFMTENLEEDEEVAKLVNEYTEELDKEMEQVIGKTTVDLDGERGTVRRKESNLANVIADSLVELTDADIALQNGGGVRASIDKGDITLKDVYTVLPFDNAVVVLELDGKTIWDTLEHGVSSYPSAAGMFLQVSGLEYTFDAAKEPGERIVSVTIDGKDIEMDKSYKVVTNDFLSGGGDKFDMLKEGKVTLKTKYYLRDSFKEYLLKHGTISPEVEGRITILNEVTVEE
ncbi:5'-nucleotidase C-terminal domain-containing protein [Clostridium sp. Cult3]|uniref:5'-nucleotidase C-terminal domain-containing protein n=1 Tax=Clostridium sp. Cult3 TaxID=2079004 RepID=UPI001F013070|nr:5'-nucleotidase C-terminal domain-containing protein [Clostridium sp. Cult3]MCF6460411.1 hypothetical protein [Clostridium sp. Cult3]